MKGTRGQLLFQKVFIHRNVFAKQYAQYNDVGPAVVIADQQIPVLFVQLLQTLNVPLQPGVQMQQDRRGLHTSSTS